MATIRLGGGCCRRRRKTMSRYTTIKGKGTGPPNATSLRGRTVLVFLWRRGDSTTLQPPQRQPALRIVHPGAEWRQRQRWWRGRGWW